ncbi:hypothetical protein [Rhodococcus oxybenzonivorans]|nr:hypothetical protein [Rhodococcus oxybenzonivorans]
MSDEQDPARSDDDHTVALLARTRTQCQEYSDIVGVDGAAG